jgi:hypothetical protein
LKTHGITLNEYNDMLAFQGGVCAICRGTPNRFDVDHDHVSGRVRGLLCNPCNQGLGYFHDNTTAMRTAITYLETIRDCKV